MIIFPFMKVIAINGSKSVKHSRGFFQQTMKLKEWTINFGMREDGYHGPLEVGDEVYFLSMSLGEHSGIFWIGDVAEKPEVFPFKSHFNEWIRSEFFEDIPAWAKRYLKGDDVFFFDKERLNRVEYLRRFRVGIKLKYILNVNNFIPLEALKKDPLFAPLIKLTNPGLKKTHFLISEEQSNSLRIICNNGPSLNKSSKGQGYFQNPLFNRAVEKHAVDMAINHYQKLGFEVKDTGDFESFDLSCFKNGTERRVEVKGSTTDSSTIILTRLEVEHAQKKLTPVDLFLVSLITVSVEPGGLITNGGNLKIIEGWVPLDEDLVVKTYDYKVP